MPEATAGLYQLILEQTFYEQKVLNVFWYVDSNFEDGLGTLLNSLWINTILDEWQDFVTVDLDIEALRTINVGTTNADITSVIQQPGSSPTPSEPAFVAASARLVRASKDVGGDGFKRVRGVPSGGVTDGQIIGVDFTDWQTLANLFDDPLDKGDGSFFVPVIVNRKSLADGLPEFKYSTIQAVNARARVTTQNSSKIGVGE